jgi:hypothetical protein
MAFRGDWFAIETLGDGPVNSQKQVSQRHAESGEAAGDDVA